MRVRGPSATAFLSTFFVLFLICTVFVLVAIAIGGLALTAWEQWRMTEETIRRGDVIVGLFLLFLAAVLSLTTWIHRGEQVEARKRQRKAAEERARRKAEREAYILFKELADAGVSLETTERLSGLSRQEAERIKLDNLTRPWDE